jgi:hypothetical protein
MLAIVDKLTFFEMSSDQQKCEKHKIYFHKVTNDKIILFSLFSCL